MEIHASRLVDKITSYEDKITVIIQFKDRDIQANRDFIESINGEIRYELSHINAISARIKYKYISELRKNKNVKNIELNIKQERYRQPYRWHNTQIKSDQAIDILGVKGTNIKVGIIDGENYFVHYDLYANYGGGWNFITNTANGTPNEGEFVGYHSTRIAGIISAIDNNAGVIGIAPESKFYVLTNGAEDSAQLEATLAAHQWAINNGMQVLNMSYDLSVVQSQLTQDSLQAIYNAGIVSCAASGNQGGLITGSPAASYSAYTSVLSIGSTDSTGTRVSWSNYGPELDLVAPGDGVYTTSIPIDGDYTYASGTSFSAPCVCGAAALVLDANPNLTNAQVMQILCNAAQDIGGQGWDQYNGYGIVDCKAAVDAALIFDPCQIPTCSINIV